MVKKENYPNAYREVYVILQNIDRKDFDLIPSSFLQMIEKNMNKDYNFEFNSNDFEKQDLMHETKAILAYLYLNYWATEKEKNDINQKFYQEIVKDEEKKKLQYNSKNMFEKRELKKEENEIIVIQKENFVTKIINKIKRFFN